MLFFGCVDSSNGAKAGVLDRIMVGYQVGVPVSALVEHG